jgi:hypothetical protein
MKKIAVLCIAFFAGIVQAQQEPIVTDSTSRSTIDSTNRSVNETTVNSPPPSAISPSMNILNNDLCTVGIAGAVQTQILGISGGSTVRDLNCERIKLAKNLFDMGMKVAAVATLCQDDRVFAAMNNAGTPCPIDGKIGEDAKRVWAENPNRQPKSIEEQSSDSRWEKIFTGFIGIILILALL